MNFELFRIISNMNFRIYLDLKVSLSLHNVCYCNRYLKDINGNYLETVHATMAVIEQVF